MRRSQLTISLILLFLFTANAYNQFTFVGVSGDYGTKIKEPGFSAMVYYTVNQQIDLTPNFTYYLSHKEDIPDGEKKSSWWSANLDGHYNIIQTGKLEGFGLMGLNLTSITTQTIETIQGQEFKDKKNVLKAGLNAGFGGALHLSDFFTPFAEVKLTLADKESFQAGFRLGILVRITADKERETEEY